MSRITIYVHKPSDIPTVEHWAIFEGSSVTKPGDERSRTNPGHGYPESTEHFISYEAYLDRAEFEAVVQSRMKDAFLRREIRCAHVIPLKIETTVKVVVG